MISIIIKHRLFIITKQDIGDAKVFLNLNELVFLVEK